MYHGKQVNNGKRQQAQRGVSLIEVLVVLVILVVGILTIIRLFPSGFFSIQSTGNAALANSLGSAAIDLGAQNAENLPDAILPDDLKLGMDDLDSAVTNAAAYSNYDPDDPNNLENARVVTNETITIPTVSNNQSIYVVKYGPVSMPLDPTSATDLASLPKYFTANSPYWTAQSGNSSLVPPANLVPVDAPQDTLVPGREQFLVDLTNKKIAVPYAAYTADGTTSMTTGTPAVTVQNAVSYPQSMVAVITFQDGSTCTEILAVPAGTTRNGTNPYAPHESDGVSYLPDAGMTSGSGYQGGWFDPTSQFGGTAPSSSQMGQSWMSVTLYRPYAAVTQGSAFSNDPYQFQLSAGNIGGVNNANPGVVSFNPKAATGSGAQARQAKISYIVYSWSILREDHDIPALSGNSTFAVRTAVPNLLLAGSANPDNSINPGLAGSNESLVILDITTGQIVAPSPPTASTYDPTNPDAPINNEDLNGTKTGPSYTTGSQIGPSYTNVSYSLGRLTFASDAFGDNSKPNTDPNQAGTAPAHRIRIFYTADLNWAVAVQKAPAYFSLSPNVTAGMATGTSPLGASEFAYDSTDAFVYFARCNAGKTVEVDGTYTLNGKTQGFSDTVAVSAVLNNVGDSNVSVNLNDPAQFAYPVPPGAAVTFSAVRGLSARSVVAWKERNVYKVHSVDAVLNRTTP